MADLTTTLKDKGFQNWLKGGLAIVFTKNGLNGFVTEEITEFQKYILASISTKHAISTGTICTSCTTENVLSCPTANFCPRGRNCSLHDSFLSNRNPRQCPNNICQAVRDDIRREHRYNVPSWKNTDATGWCTDPFQIAKCFMPPDGYSSVHTFADTDFNGMISIIINNKRFANKMNTNLDDRRNICTEARDVGRFVRHKADMSISDDDLSRTIKILINLLSDIKCLTSDPKALEVVDKLNKLKANTLTITTQDITLVLNEGFKEIIAREQDNAFQAINKEGGEAQKKFLKELKDSLASMETVTLNNLDQLVKTKMNEIKQVAEKEKKELAEISAKGKQEIKEEILKGIGQTQAEEGTEKNSKETELEKCLQEDLVSFYRKYHSTIPVSPLVEEHDVPLVDFYVQPPLSSVDIQRKFGRIRESSTRTKVHTINDVFLQKDGNIYKDIYITAKAGIGKTSFVKRIGMIWCQAFEPLEELENKFSTEEVTVMKSFPFLFMISLRDIDSSLCYVDDMIFSQIIKGLARFRRFNEIFIEDILQERHCLVILDGLDEWTHPDCCTVGRKNEHGLPHRPARKNCTIMTTTRPWKLDVLRLGTNQIDRHVDIIELDQSSSKQLISNAVALLNKRSLSRQCKTVDGFQATVSATMLDSVRYIPYILLQMVCLWFDDESIGNSKCEIYSNILELTLTRGQMKLSEQQWTSLIRDNLDNESWPNCFSSNELCREQYSLILNLGQIAFETLFCLKKEATIVFDASKVLERISEEALSFCLKLGLLSQNKDCQKLSSRRRTFSFQHKSVQEYMAALYIQSDPDNTAVKDKISSMCCSLPTLLEMSNTFVFLGGFSSSACGKAFRILRRNISNDETLAFYRENLLIKEYGLTEFWKVKETIRAFQYMQTDIMQEIISSGQADFPLYIEDIIIDNTTDKSSYPLLRILVEQNKDYIQSLYVRDIRCTDDFTDIVEVTGMLSLRILQKLIVIAVPRPADLLSLLSNSASTLKCLRLSFVEYRDNLYYPKHTALSSEAVRAISSTGHLSALMLSNVFLSHADVKIMFEILGQRTQMTEIGLYHFICSDHSAHCCGELLNLSQHQCLKTLNLDKTPVAELRVNPSSLNECLIGEDTTSVFPLWFNCLTNAPNLHSLWFRRMTPVLLDGLLITLPQLVQLKKFGIEITDIGDRSLRLLPGVNIESVYLYKVAMTAMTLKQFAESAAALSSPIKITLEWCKVTPMMDYYDLKDYFRESPKYVVKLDGLNFRHLDHFEFETVVNAR